MRRMYDVPLLRSHTPMLALTWLVLHPIREGSPFFGHTVESLEQSDFALVATIRGLDETISQTVHAKHAYRKADIRWQHRFVDMFTENENAGRSSIDLTRIHDTYSV